MKNRLIPKPIAILLLWGLTAAVLTGCSVMSKDIRQQAAPGVNFSAIKRNADAYAGKTVIVGGYILEIENLPDQTRLMVLQTPLDFQDEPGARERSQGRFRVVHQGFLDPAIYQKDRKITVAGKVTGAETVRINKHDYTLPVLRMQEIHLWQERREPPDYPYFYDPFYPWPDPRFRYWHHPYFYR